MRAGQVHFLLNFSSDDLKGFFFRGDSSQIGRDQGPLNSRQRESGEARDLSVLNFYDHGSLRADFADTAALEITWEDDRRVGTDHFVFVTMAERPVLVAALQEILYRTRGVVGMRRAPVARCMQHTDIEHTGFGGGIRQRQVFRNRSIGEALTVQCNLQFWYPEGLRPLEEKTLTESGNVTALVITLSASWLPRTL